jgi:hypothetical protein
MESVSIKFVWCVTILSFVPKHRTSMILFHVKLLLIFLFYMYPRRLGSILQATEGTCFLSKFLKLSLELVFRKK